MKKGLGASDMEVVTLGAKHNGMHSESIYWYRAVVSKVLATLYTVCGVDT